MSTRAFLQAFGTVFPAELPDKTMLATIVLVTRYRRPFPVWVGAISAFAVHVTVAVTAGRLIGLLPRAPVQLGVATMFLIGAVLLFRAARGAEEIEADSTVEEQATLWANVDGSLRRQPPTPRTIVAGSFGLIILAEWGDLTQLATASLAARNGEPVWTGLGAWLALCSVAGIASTFGRGLVARVPIRKINYVGATVFAGLALWTLSELI